MHEGKKEGKSGEKRMEITENSFWYIAGKRGITIADAKAGLSKEIVERIRDGGKLKDSTVIRVEIDAEEGTVDAKTIPPREYDDDVIERIMESNKEGNE